MSQNLTWFMRPRGRNVQVKPVNVTALKAKSLKRIAKYHHQQKIHDLGRVWEAGSFDSKCLESGTQLAQLDNWVKNCLARQKNVRISLRIELLFEYWFDTDKHHSNLEWKQRFHKTWRMIQNTRWRLPWSKKNITEQGLIFFLFVFQDRFFVWFHFSTSVFVSMSFQGAEILEVLLAMQTLIRFS